MKEGHLSEGMGVIWPLMLLVGLVLMLISASVPAPRSRPIFWTGLMGILGALVSLGQPRSIMFGLAGVFFAIAAVVLVFRRRFTGETEQ